MRNLTESATCDQNDLTRTQRITNIFKDIDPTGILIDTVINKLEQIQSKDTCTNDADILPAIFIVYMENSLMTYTAGHTLEEKQEAINIIDQIVTFATKIDQVVPSVHQCFFQTTNCAHQRYAAQLAYVKLKLLGIVRISNSLVSKFLSNYPNPTEIAEFKGMWTSKTHFDFMLTILRNRILDRFASKL